jgi:tetratricopeptide (TPR) repeat protein
MKRALIVSVLTLAGQLIAQPIEPTTEPIVETPEPESTPEQAERLGAPDTLGETTQALKDQLNASFLSDDERAELRVEHGLWTQEDLADPVYAAKASLALGNYTDPALADPLADPFDRAQAALMRGEPQRAINILDERLGGLQPPSYLFVRAQALEMLGQTDRAIETLEELETLMTSDIVSRADELAFAVDGLIQLTRLRGPQTDAKAEYQNLAKLLANARDHLDRLNWRVRFVEAKLLYAHNNYNDARDAAIEALRLHPRNAQVAALIGNMAVDSFDFDTAEDIANKLDAIASVGADNPPATLHSSILRARIALRRKDPEGAEAALDPMLAVMPEQRDLLALNAAAAAAGFRTISTQHLLEQYDALSPNSPFAVMRVASTLSEYRQYAYAAEMYRRIIQRAPFWGEPRLGLGLLLVQAGRDQEAKETLADALKLDPFDIRAQNSLKLVTELAAYATIETPHFVIRFKPGTTDEILANEMPPVLERIHDRATGTKPGGVDFEPRAKTIIELMPNHEWFAVRIGGMPSIHTMAASTGPVIAIEAPNDTKKSSVGHYNWARVLQHEYTHTVNLARTHNRVIHWMTEANAVYNEDAPRSSQTWALLTDAYEHNTLFDLVEINTAFVRPKKPTDRSLAYAQGAWMFEYIVERYSKQAPLDIFDASAAGRDAVDAFEETLGVTPESFLTEFRDWAKQQLLDRGLILPDGVPDLTELFDTESDDPDNPPKIPTLAEIDKLLTQYPDHPQLITLQIGIALMGADTRLTDAQVALLARAIKVRPTDESPHRRLAKHYLAGDTLEERAKAVPALEYLDARETYSPAFAGELALLYAQTNQPELAMSKALRAVRIAPYDADQRERAARVALLTGNLQEAKHQLEALVKLEPDRAIHQRRLDAFEKPANANTQLNE